jgi:sterol desaturase/sphingolipid hydroxylase (fatty acid hydroxylase superfamily)
MSDVVFLGAVFAVLLGATWFSEPGREALRDKPAVDWGIDLANLSIQGLLVPLVELVVLVAVLGAAVPELRGSLVLPAGVAFALNVVVVDYLYYWNHRAMHSRALFPLHRLHHSVHQMDVLGTSRNTLWTTFVIVYVWVNGTMLYLLADPVPFAAGAAVTAALDLWRHSSLHPPAWLARWLRGWLILPADHHRHHGASIPLGNFGANLAVWDRLHGTWLGETAPEPLGRPDPHPLRSLVWPFP